MIEFLKEFKSYQGNNPKLKAFAKRLEDIEDDYDEMLEMLEEELEELEEQGELENVMFDSDTEHLLCQNELI